MFQTSQEMAQIHLGLLWRKFHRPGDLPYRKGTFEQNWNQIPTKHDG
jgi:hypothetical protein